MFHLWSNFFYKNKHGKFFPLSQDFLIWPLQTNVTFYLDPPMSVGTPLPIQILLIPRDHIRNQLQSLTMIEQQTSPIKNYYDYCWTLDLDFGTYEIQYCDIQA